MAITTYGSDAPSGPVGVELFCGAGGMSLGFRSAGVRVALAVDADPLCVGTHTRNFPGCTALLADVTQLSAEDLRREGGLADTDIDVLFGGPPCQGVSMMGERRIDDPRNQLIGHFARLVAETQPRYFVMENVAGPVDGKAIGIVEAFVETVAAASYSVVTPIQVLDAADFGVPQHRRRAFILGCRRGETPPHYPCAPVGRRAKPPTVEDAIGDLPDIEMFGYLMYEDAYLGELGVPSAYARALRQRGSDQQAIRLVVACGPPTPSPL